MAIRVLYLYYRLYAKYLSLAGQPKEKGEAFPQKQ